MLVLVYVLLVFCVVSGAMWMVSAAMDRRQRLRMRVGQVSQRLEALAPAVTAPAPTSGPETPEERPDVLPTVTSILDGSTLDKKLRLEMLRAGLRLRPAEFVVLCSVSAVFLGLLGLWQTGQPLMGLALGALGAGVPVGILKQRQEARRKRFDGQIADALTLIASSLRAGYSFQRALQMVAEEMPAPMSEEFDWALAETSLGVPTEIALRNMVDRVKSYDLDLVVTAVMIQLQVGGNLAEILDTISETIRERVRIQLEINALTAEGKLSGIVLFGAPILLALILLLRDPNYFKPLLDAPMGMYVIIGTVVMQIIGGVVIKQMITLDI